MDVRIGTVPDLHGIGNDVVINDIESLAHLAQPFLSHGSSYFITDFGTNHAARVTRNVEHNISKRKYFQIYKERCQIFSKPNHSPILPPSIFFQIPSASHQPIRESRHRPTYPQKSHQKSRQGLNCVRNNQNKLPKSCLL